MIYKLIFSTVICLQVVNSFSQASFSDGIQMNVTAKQSISALKEGFTIGDNKKPVNYLSSNETVIWEADRLYQNDVAGIGRDSILNFYQKVANSGNEDAIIRIKLAEDNKRLKDQSFLIWGNNDAPLELSKQGIMSESIRERLMRKWKVQNNGIAKVDLSVALPDLHYSGCILSDFELLITDKHGNFTNSSLVKRVAADSLSHGVLYFKNLQFNKTQVFTLATDIQHKPQVLFPRERSAKMGHFYRKTFRVVDRDKDRVLLTIKHLPNWLSIINNKNGTYTILGKPTATDKESYIFSFLLNDGLEIVDFSLEIPVVSLNRN